MVGSDRRRRLRSTGFCRFAARHGHAVRECLQAPRSSGNDKTYHFTFCFETNTALGRRDREPHQHDDHQRRGVQDPPGHPDRRSPWRRGRPTCIYVDAAGFDNSANGIAILFFTTRRWTTRRRRSPARSPPAPTTCRPAARVPTRATTRSSRTRRDGDADTRPDQLRRLRLLLCSTTDREGSRPLPVIVGSQKGLTSSAVPWPRDPGQHDRGLVVAVQGEPLAELVGDDVDAALLDGQPCRCRAPAGRRAAAFSR